MLLLLFSCKPEPIEPCTGEISIQDETSDKYHVSIEGVLSFDLFRSATISKVQPGEYETVFTNQTTGEETQREFEVGCGTILIVP